MFLSVKAKLAFLAMPKCASSSIEAAAGARAGVVYNSPPSVKHMNCRRFDEFIRPWLAHVGVKDVETVCLFREPLEWCESYWRYRRRPNMKRPENSTAGLSFDRFLNLYIDQGASPANIGRPSRFVANAEGGIGVSRIYRFEHLADCFDYICERMEIGKSLPKRNISPSAPRERAALAPETLARFRDHMAREYEIYESIAL